MNSRFLKSRLPEVLSDLSCLTRFAISYDTMRSRIFILCQLVHQGGLDLLEKEIFLEEIFICYPLYLFEFVADSKQINLRLKHSFPYVTASAF
jgi:membrane-bound acyltransferase YfiQ involved in biofilm formation